MAHAADMAHMADTAEMPDMADTVMRDTREDWMRTRRARTAPLRPRGRSRR